MTEDQPRPAASLTADRIRRTAPPVVPQVAHAAPMPSRPERERLPLSSSAMGESVVEGGGSVSFVNWRRAGLFGILYLGALIIFATAFDVWTVLGR